MKSIVFIITLFVFALPAQSAGMFSSIDNRTDAMNAELKGNNSYHAHLARALADAAADEKSQHDTGVAKEFMRMAEEHAAQAGGAK